MELKISEFVTKYIHSVWHLELLLLLKKKVRPMSAQEIAGTMYLSKDVVENALSVLLNYGLIQFDNKTKGYFYSPVDSTLTDQVEQTEKEYRDKRVTVVNMIFAKEKVRHKD